MSDQSDKARCRMGCWALAAAAGVLTFLLLMAIAGHTFLSALFLGALLFVLLGLLLTWLFCAPVARMNDAPSAASSAQASAQPGTSSTSATAGAATAAAATSAAATARAASAAEDAASEDTSTAAEADAVASIAATDEGNSDAGDAGDDSAGGDIVGNGATATSDDDAGSAKVQPSAPLAGTAELADRKGTWKYEGSADAEAAETPAATAAAVDYDNDGKLEGTDEGTRPEALDGPRDGKADNLKEIKGIGPKLEKLCNSLGFYHFDQIAGWSADEVAWVNANLAGFKGRVSRDEWVKQARILAAGGETEFSKRVEDGDVY